MQALKYKTLGSVVVKTDIWSGFTVKDTKTLEGHILNICNNQPTNATK